MKGLEEYINEGKGLPATKETIIRLLDEVGMNNRIISYLEYKDCWKKIIDGILKFGGFSEFRRNVCLKGLEELLNEE